jgi:hypothetical protein
MQMIDLINSSLMTVHDFRFYLTAITTTEAMSNDLSSVQDTPEVEGRLPMNTLEECEEHLREQCFACHDEAEDLSQVCMTRCQSTRATRVLRLLCGPCDEKISAFYQEHNPGLENQQDVWLFHVLHHHLEVTMRAVDKNRCVICSQRDKTMTNFTSRCCNESTALDMKSMICMDCLQQARDDFLQAAPTMAIPDFSTYMFHRINCT